MADLVADGFESCLFEVEQDCFDVVDVGIWGRGGVGVAGGELGGEETVDGAVV